MPTCSWRLCSLWRWKLSIGVEMPRWARSRPVRRVSSARIREACLQAAGGRKVDTSHLDRGGLTAGSGREPCLRTRLARGLFEESGQQLWVCCHDTAPLSGMQSRQPSPQAAGATSF